MKSNFGRGFVLAAILVLGYLGLSACSGSTPVPTEALSMEAIRTSVVGTFAAELTQTALSQPTNTPTETPTVISTPELPTATTTLRAPTASCFNLIYIRDVTIPDNTPMLPGEAFTKTWLVRNTGGCAWAPGFRFQFIAGNAMGGTPYVVITAVDPGEELEISIAMTAPSQTGPAQGTWRMSTAGGAFFGEALFVLINVTPATPTATTRPP